MRLSSRFHQIILPPVFLENAFTRGDSPTKSAYRFRFLPAEVITCGAGRLAGNFRYCDTVWFLVAPSSVKKIISPGKGKCPYVHTWGGGFSIDVTRGYCMHIWPLTLAQDNSQPEINPTPNGFLRNNTLNAAVRG